MDMRKFLKVLRVSLFVIENNLYDLMFHINYVSIKLK